MEAQPFVDDSAAESQRWLFRFEDGGAFAYARRREFIRCSDERAWAYMFHDRLISARSGQCLAVRVGNVYYDAVSHEPLYYELT
jgi:hypothetical protein